MATLYVGDTARIDATITVDGVLTDPTALSITVEGPAGAETHSYPSAELTRLSTGRYRAAINCTAAGTWQYRWISPGPTAKGALQGAFDVQEQNVT